MSIYRKLNAYRRPSDGYAHEPAKKEPVALRAVAQETAVREDYTHLRQAAAPNTPLPGTLQWAASLPPNVHPTALLRHYGRIANVIAATWRNPGSFETYMESLLTDKRQNRRGFPYNVLMELLALQRWHNTLRRSTSGLNTANKG